jgi:hypothetical protein
LVASGGNGAPGERVCGKGRDGAGVRGWAHSRISPRTAPASHMRRTIAHACSHTTSARALWHAVRASSGLSEGRLKCACSLRSVFFSAMSQRLQRAPAKRVGSRRGLAGGLKPGAAGFGMNALCMPRLQRVRRCILRARRKPAILLLAGGHPSHASRATTAITANQCRAQQ